MADELDKLEGWKYSKPRRWFAWRPIITHDGLLVWLTRVWRWVEYPPRWLAIGFTPAPPVTKYGFEPPLSTPPKEQETKS